MPDYPLKQKTTDVHMINGNDTTGSLQQRQKSVIDEKNTN